MSRKRISARKADWIILASLSAFATMIVVTDILIFTGRIG